MTIARACKLLAIPALFCAIGFSVSGCHKASELDCERIVDRIVELELREQGITSPALVEKRKNEIHAQKRDELLHGCVGQTIGKTAMTCIDQAESSKEITETCLQ